MESRKTKIISVVAIVALLLIVFGIGVGVTLLYMNNKYKVYEDEEPKQIKKHVDTISMMLETSAGSGNYEMTTRSEWPTEGYVFNANLSKCENGSELSWDNENKKVLMSGNKSDKCYVYFDKFVSLAEYVKSLYTGTQGENGIYYHDASLTNGAGDNSYRYSGDESGVKNYICINSSDATCPDDNLFRIIGVFNGNTKVIKASSYGSTIAWHSKDTGTWADSSLNTTLNSTYLNTYLSEIKNKIVNVTWNVGVLNDSSYTAKNAYTAEISQTYSSAKIGLITVSDYLYTLIPDTWTTSSSSLSNFSSWMSSNENDWTLNIYDGMGSKYFAWVINESGNADPSNGYITFKYGYARPVFYLNSTVNYVDGTGISSDPIRIN